MSYEEEDTCIRVPLRRQPEKSSVPRGLLSGKV
jgi:hypothetical protein